MRKKVTILCGLPGSGKSWYTKDFKDQEGIVVFNLDTELFRRLGKGFPSEKYQEYETETKQSLLKEAQSLLEENKHVIFDYGFWKMKEREEYRAFADVNDADFELLYFSVPAEVLQERLSKRNIDEAEDNHIITPEMLRDFENQFEPPVEQENAVEY